MDAFEQKLKEIEIYGFTLVENVLNDDEVAEMREALIKSEEEIGTESGHRGTASHVSNLVTRSPAFFKCIDHPKVLPFIEATMGDDLILGSLNSRIVRPGDGYQGLHSDIPGQLLRGDQPPIMMNTVWTLCDYTKEMGATRVVPGTHRSNLGQPPEGFDVKYEFQAICPAGSVIIFNGQTWHGGGENSSDSDRYALFGHYRVGPWTRFQVDPHHHFPEEWFDLLNERQKQLLRMTRGLGHPHGADGYERL
jgi:ectoine hydroxylase-related dioxygenase (phytanoyl-CoA dioxygenase family)